ncbi:MAG: choice-of-anchor J domain-containing protein [Salinibacter sp.]
MSLSSPLRFAVLTLAVFPFLVGCDGFDSGTPPNAPGEGETTVSFATQNISITEENSPVEIDVTISNPPGREVRAEVLYADGASSTDPSDFNLQDSTAVGNGIVAGTVVFPDTATDGNTQTLELDIQDEEENEPQEDGLFVMQDIQGASIGEADQLTISIGAIEIFEEDFSDEALDPMTAINVTNGNGWDVGSFEGNFYAGANGFGGSEAANTWLVTPALNFNEFEDETLTFRNANNFDDEGIDQALQVKVSTDYDGSGNPEDFTWTDVTDRVENFSEGGYEYVSSGEIDLSDSEFQGDEVYVAFQYRSSGTGGGTSEEWQVDDVRVVGR